MNTQKKDFFMLLSCFTYSVFFLFIYYFRLRRQRDRSIWQLGRTIVCFIEINGERNDSEKTGCTHVKKTISDWRVSK